MQSLNSHGYGPSFNDLKLTKEKNFEMKKTLKVFKPMMLPMNLQLFATPPEGGAEDKDKKDDAENDDENDDKPEKKYSDDDVDEIVKKKLAKAEREKAEAIKEAEKLAKMNAEEKQKYEFEKLEAKVAEYERKEARAGLAKEASKMLGEKEIQAPDEVVDMLVGADAEATQTAVKSVISWVEDLHKQWEIKRNTGKTPGKFSNTDNFKNPFSKEHFNLTEQGRLLREDPERYKALKALAENK